jgi:hypothetical protein
MSGFGSLYAVSDEARGALATVQAKSAWYAILGTLQLEDAPTLNTEQSLAVGLLAFANAPAPLSQIATGEFQTEKDGSGDPNVAFFGRSLVGQIAERLAVETEEQYADLIRATGNDPVHKWLFGPMRRFFSEAASDGLAIVMLWGR